MQRPVGTTGKFLLAANQVCVATDGDWSVAMAGRKTVKDSVKLSVSTVASTESVSVRANASVSLDTPGRRAIKI